MAATNVAEVVLTVKEKLSMGWWIKTIDCNMSRPIYSS